MRSLFVNSIALVSIILASCCAMAQSLPMPKISVSADSGRVTIVTNYAGDWNIPINTTTTNFNPSTPLADTSFVIPLDSLQSDKTATIVTVYETDEDNLVGLWHISNSGTHRLWLNSQQASYEDFSIRYRKDNEIGVVVHTMTYSYPELDSLYDGHDTLRIGICDTVTGSKNFCSFQYFDTKLSARQQRVLESALAIRYGAWLHGSYLNSTLDTLWDTRRADSTFSYGICGIGRDDSIFLIQPKSIIRNDILTISSSEPQQNLSYVMMGHDSNDVVFNTMPVMIEGNPFFEVKRHWKLRSHGSDTISISFSIDSLFPGCRLMIESDGDNRIFDINDKVLITGGKDYHISVFVPMERKSSGKTQHTAYEMQEKHSCVSMESSVKTTPNPTSGRYTVSVSQTTEDFVEIRVVDANGRTVETYKTPDRVTEYRHDSSLSESGIYYITISSNGAKQTIKLIVVK